MMGRKRLSNENIKKPIKLSLRAEDIKTLREQGINISNLVQEMITDYLKNQEQK